MEPCHWEGPSRAEVTLAVDGVKAATIADGTLDLAIDAAGKATATARVGGLALTGEVVSLQLFPAAPLATSGAPWTDRVAVSFGPDGLALAPPAGARYAAGPVSCAALSLAPPTPLPPAAVPAPNAFEAAKAPGRAHTCARPLAVSRPEGGALGTLDAGVPIEVDPHLGFDELDWSTPGLARHGKWVAAPGALAAAGCAPAAGAAPAVVADLVALAAVAGVTVPPGAVAWGPNGARWAGEGGLVGLFLERSPEQRWWAVARSWPVGEVPAAKLGPTTSRSVQVGGKAVPVECGAVDGPGKWVVCTVTGRHQLGLVVPKANASALLETLAAADLAAVGR